MSKSKAANALDAFVRGAPTPPNTAPAPNKPLAAGRRADQQMIPYRVSAEAHRALKILAAHDQTSLQAMIDQAVRAYAAQRNVKLP